MASKLEELEREILLLSAHDRALLAKNILLSLENDEDVDAEPLWIEEAKKRSRAYIAKNTTSQPVENVMDELRSKFHP